MNPKYKVEDWSASQKELKFAVIDMDDQLPGTDPSFPGAFEAVCHAFTRENANLVCEALNNREQMREDRAVLAAAKAL